MNWLVEVWREGDSISSNRYYGPFRSESRAELFARGAEQGTDLNARAVELRTADFNLGLEDVCRMAGVSTDPAGGPSIRLTDQRDRP